MAKFLQTNGVSYYLEKLIKNTNEQLILVSPYLQLSDRIKEHLKNLNIQKKDIRIIYRENKLHVEENKWLEDQIGIRTSICKNLHAKCYMNEQEAIITSMNLYEFSQQNNNEMGIYFTKKEDPQLYQDTQEEVNRLLTISDEVRVSVKKVDKEDVKASGHHGYCIRTGKKIDFNIERPFSKEAFKIWNEYADPDYPEKYCHFSGEKSNGNTSFSRPVLKKYWKKAMNK